MSPLFTFYITLIIFLITLIYGVPAFRYAFVFVEEYIIVPRNVRHFEKRVTKRLDKEGYKWERDEWDLYVIKNDIRLRVRFVRLQGRPAIRVIFEYKTKADDALTVSPLDMLITALSMDYTETPTFVQDNVIYSYYKADIRTTREFILELNCAYNKFGTITHALAKYTANAKQDLSASAK